MTSFEEQAARFRDEKWDAAADDGHSDAFMARYDRRILLHALDQLRAPHNCMAAEQEIERLSAELDAYKAAREATYKEVGRLK